MDTYHSQLHRRLDNEIAMEQTYREQVDQERREEREAETGGDE